MKRAILMLPLLIALAACRAETPGTDEHVAEIEPPSVDDTLREVEAAPVDPDDAAHEPPAREPREQVARVRIVDLDGQPIPGMMPIATTRPNAFDAPVTQGPPSGSDGRSAIALDPDQWLYIRAWDPSMTYFANNYYEAPPGDAPIHRELDLILVEHASLRMRLTHSNGEPVEEETVAVMLYHPDRGPWWPIEGLTDVDGQVELSPVPAGSYLLRIQAEHGGRTELPEVHLPPGSERDLGGVPLQPQ